MSHVINLSLKADPRNAFVYLGQLDRKLTLQHCKVLRPDDNIYCGMADYILHKCIFGGEFCCVKAHIIPYMAKYVAQYDKIHQDNESIIMGSMKVRIYGKDIFFEQLHTVQEMKDRILQRGSAYIIFII